MRASIVLVVAVAACAGGGPVGTLRFVNQPPVARVNDRKPFAPIPKERIYNRTLYHTDGFFVRRLTRAMDLPPPVRAQDVNSFDEVPDSTWFTNRIGVRDLSIEEITTGPYTDPSPFDNLPWTIKSAKVGGTSVGFVFEDKLGAKYLLKFDVKDVPEMETGAHVIGHKIMWACGFNVPQDRLGYIRREDLIVAPDATQKDALGKKRPLTAAEVDKALSFMYRTADGRWRVLASKFTPGKPIGPAAREGRRRDDPNDRIPHERRRTLRGQFAIFSWMNHSDIQEDQTLDTFMTESKESKQGFVMHWSLDWGKAFGVMGKVNNWQTPGFTFRIDFGMALRGFLALGTWKRQWEDVKDPNLRGVGLWEAESFDPAGWRTNSPYWPFFDRDRFDGFWAAKIIMRFTREQLAAIVGVADFSDPRATAYFLDVLVQRQRKTARYYFERVAPLDRFTVMDHPQGMLVCFDDLLLSYQLSPVGGWTEYLVDAFDHAGRPTGPLREYRPDAKGHACAAGNMPGADHDGYTIVRIRVRRGGRIMPPVLVHLARAASGTMQLIGLRRE